jgi:hypothetical protein
MFVHKLLLRARDSYYVSLGNGFKIQISLRMFSLRFNSYPSDVVVALRQPLKTTEQNGALHYADKERIGDGGHREYL